MVCFTNTVLIPPELAELLATKPFYVEGLRQVGAMLPESDEELHVVEAIAKHEENGAMIGDASGFESATCSLI